MTEGDAVDVEHVLIEAIHDRRLVEVVSAPRRVGIDPAHPLFAAADAATFSVGSTARRHAERVRRVLDDGDVDATVADPDDRLQLATVDVTVDRDEVPAARRALERAGYAPIRRLSEGAWRAQVHWSASFLFAARGGSSAQVLLRWGSPATTTRVRRAIVPSGPQLGRIDLPGAAWPLYSIVRVVDLVRRRLGRRPHDRDLGPTLPTPDSLVEPLLDVAGVGPDDTLLDVGCGDGSVVIAAVRSRGCRGLGVELDATLVESARRSARAAGVADRTEFHAGDVAEADLTGVSTAFVFLPASSVPRVIEGLGASLPAGARIVAHEIDRLGAVRAPDRSVPVFADGAISVAHLWTV